MSENAVKYNFSDFTLEAYDQLLVLAKENHTFIGYDEIDSSLNFCLWRHDIDVSVENAVSLSKIESAHSVKSTYFIHLHSSFYNFFDLSTKRMIAEIVKGGHSLGLHFDADYYGVSTEKDLETYLLLEKKLLESAFGQKIEVFSYHNPNEKILTHSNYQYAGMINTYSDDVKKSAVYSSDSNGYWRHKSIRQTILENQDRSLHILTHPEWWNKDVDSPKQRIEKLVYKKADSVIDEYSTQLKLFGRENIDW